MSHEEPQASWSELLRGRRGMQSLALVGCVALEATNVFLVTTIMPSVVKDIGGFSYYAMNTTMFVIASILGAAIAGRMAERIGSKRILMIGLGIFAGATVVAALAPTMYILILARTIEGFAGGILLSMAYVLIRQVFEERLWPRAVGLVSAMWGIATFSGPAIGGIFTEIGHWRWAFWSMLPFNALLVLLVLVWLPTPQTPPRTAEDDAQNVLPIARLVLLTLSVLMVSASSVLHVLWQQGVLIVIGALCLAQLIYIDKDAKNPILPTGSYGPSAQRAIYITMSVLALASTIEIFAPYFFQIIQGHSPIYAGYLTTAMSAGWSFSALFGSGVRRAWGRRAIQFGPILMSAALFCFAWVSQQQSGVQQGWGLAGFVLNLVLIGMGIGLAWPHLLSTLFRIVPDSQGAIASSSVSTVQQYAMAIGSALAGLIVNTTTRGASGDVTAVSRAAFWTFIIFASLLLIAIASAHQTLRRTQTSA